MSKISAFIGIFFASALLFTSCEQEVEVWDSETLDYSGRYVIKLMNEDMSEVIVDYDGSELMIYNTAANVANEVWLEDMAQLLPLKSKFSFSGTPDSFKSTNTEFDKLTDNILTVSLPNVAPTAEGQTKEEARDYLRAFVVDGKITPQSITTKGGNTADGLFIKVKLYSGSATFKSQKKAEKEWANPTVPEYKWSLSSVSHDATKDEVLVISGYRYTGFPEDFY